jgi:hypothetical protein
MRAGGAEDEQGRPRLREHLEMRILHWEQATDFAHPEQQIQDAMQRRKREMPPVSVMQIE